MKYKVAKSPNKTIGENKNKTNWNTYEVIYTKGYCYCHTDGSKLVYFVDK